MRVQMRMTEMRLAGILYLLVAVTGFFSTYANQGLSLVDTPLDTSALGGWSLLVGTAFLLRLYRISGLMAYLFFGLWLLPLGYLLLKNHELPNVLAYFIWFAAMGYLIDFMLDFFGKSVNWSFTRFSFWGEVMLLLFLLFGRMRVLTSFKSKL